ncbi:MAG: NUDIX hydrolase [Mycobacteriaceae bacterium]
MSQLHHSTVANLQAWCPPNPHQDALRHTMLAFLDSAPEGCLRKNVAGHITASSLVLNSRADQVLLTLHPRVGRWIQLGGHCEPSDTSIIDAALREAQEESGISDLYIDPIILALHTHPIICSLGKPTRHLDVRFLIIAPEDAKILCSNESEDLQWWPIDQLPENAEADTLIELVKLAQQRLHQ